MSLITNTTFTYQEYKTYHQANKDCGIGGRSYSKIENNSDTSDKKILEDMVITVPSSNDKYELTAEYADNFSEDEPFIKVAMNHGEDKKEYYINIDEINPYNASAVEIFALFSYANSHENNMGFSSSIWNTLTGYIKNNPSYAAMNRIEPLEKSYEQKLDWVAMVKETKDEYMDSGLYKQVSDGNKLISLFEQYGMPETVEMHYMDSEHWIPASNYVCQMETDIKAAFIEIDGNGALHYINMQDETSNWSMKITQEQLEKALKLGDEFAQYISNQSFWESYLNSDMNLTELREAVSKINQKSTYTDVLAKLPDFIREAWKNASIETGANEFGIDEDGNRIYLSEFAKQYLLSYLKNENIDFLGETVETVLKFARETLERFENSSYLQYSYLRYNSDIQELKNAEKQFYQKLIEYLE